jgi:hypothetical protein
MARRRAPRTPVRKTASVPAARGITGDRRARPPPRPARDAPARGEMPADGVPENALRPAVPRE